MSNLCVQCGKSFSSKFNLNKHERNFHSNTPKIFFNCRNKCGKTFTTKWYEKEHSKYCIIRKQISAEKKDAVTYVEEDQSYFLNIKPFLPENYHYDLIKCNLSGNVGCIFNFEVKLVQECEQWIQEFQDRMLIDFRVMSVRKTKSPIILMKRRYRCHHNTRNNAVKNPKASKKHTKCPWQIIISANANMEAKGVSVFVKLKNDHNHRLNCPENAKYRHPGEEVEQEFKKLFEEGMTAEKAYNAYSSKLKNESGNEFSILCEDRRSLPDRRWVNYLYYKTVTKTFRKTNQNVKDKFAILQQRIVNYNEKEGTVCASYLRLTSKNDFVVVIQTEFMKRVCNDNPLSQEALFVDSLGTIDRFGCAVFILMCNSSAGGLPIAVFVTSNETEKTIVSAIDLWKKNFLTPDSFYKNGLNGPKIIITDNSVAERNSFSVEFPQSTLLLCTFDLLRAVWKNIWNSNYTICDSDRQTIMMYVKQLLYCENSDQLENTFNSMMISDLLKKYSSIRDYIIKLFQRRTEWALCFQENFITGGQITNNICETAMQVMKERILERTKAYTPAQLIDFILVEFNEYYVNKLFDVAHDRPTKYLTAMDYFYQKQVTSLRIIKEHNNGVEYVIYNEVSNSTYTVNAEYGMCSCEDIIEMSGKGKFCVHQWFVCVQKKINTVTTTPETIEEKKSLLKIALGDEFVERFCEEWCNEYQYQSTCEIVENNDTDTDISVVVIDCCSDYDDDDRNSLQKNNHIDAEKVFTKFREFYGNMVNLARSDRGVLEALDTFLTNYNKLRTNSEIISELNTFGKYEIAKKKSCKINTCAGV